MLLTAERLSESIEFAEQCKNRSLYKHNLPYGTEIVRGAIYPMVNLDHRSQIASNRANRGAPLPDLFFDRCECSLVFSTKVNPGIH